MLEDMSTQPKVAADQHTTGAVAVKSDPTDDKDGRVKLDAERLPVELNAAVDHDAADGTSAAAEPRDEGKNLSAELLKHLSKEVEHVSNQLIAQRSKNNLLVAFAPYLALGILATNKDLVVRLQKIPSADMMTFNVVFVVVYLLLGWLAAKIEKNFWDQGNFWRKLIVDVSETKIPAERFTFSSENLVIVYVAIYFVSSLGFVFCLNVFRGVT